jgi:hypothetical protein
MAHRVRCDTVGGGGMAKRRRGLKSALACLTGCGCLTGYLAVGAAWLIWCGVGRVAKRRRGSKGAAWLTRC